MEPSLQAVNEYEARRAARIAQNKQRMAALGVVEAAQQLQKQQQQKKQHRWRQPTNKPRPAAVSEPIATRASKRIRGHPASEAATQVCVRVSAFCLAAKCLEWPTLQDNNAYLLLGGYCSLRWTTATTKPAQSASPAAGVPYPTPRRSRRSQTGAPALS